MSLILATVSIPMLRGFGSFTRGMHRSTRQTTAVYLAQSVLEQVRHRVLAAGPDGPPFGDLAEEGARIAADGDGPGSRYFAEFENLEGTTFHGITREADPELFRQLSRYGCRVEVYTTTGTGDLDADADGMEEPDMAEVGVTISWEAPGGSPRHTTLWTMVTDLRKAPR